LFVKTDHFTIIDSAMQNAYLICYSQRMIYTQIGEIQEKLSKITFGGASISGDGGGYGMGDISTQDAVDLVHAALDFGINLFDTAPIYGFGQSEKTLGKAFKDRRDKGFIISKSGVCWHENKRVDMNNDPLIAEQQLNDSLKRLKTDYIDLYMVHWPDKRFDIQDTLAVYKKAQQEGKIRYIGLCNTNRTEIKKASEVVKLDVIQSEYNLFNIDPLESIKADLDKRNLGFLSWGTFDKGLLTGRVTLDRKFDSSDCRSWAPWWKKSNWKEKVKKVEQLSAFIEGSGHSLVELALAHNLNHKNLSSAICGMRNLNQINSVLKSLHHLPDDSLVKEARSLVE